MSSRTLSVGVIGAGRIGRLHAENLAFQLPGVSVAAVADVRLAAAEEAASACPGARAVADPRAVLDDPRIDAVVISSSTDTHAALIEQAAAAGKHIFCEKPIDLDAGRVRGAIAACERAGVKLQVGFNRRFDPSFKRVADGVRRGEVGAPQLVRITSRDAQPPPLDYVKISGGLFLDMAIHDFDMARYLAQEEVVEVFATGSALIDPDIGAAGDVDTAVTLLRYRSGAIATIDNSRQAVYGYDQRVEVFGSRGCLTAGNSTPTQVSLWNESGQQHDRPLFFFLERYRDSYVAELRAFAQCIVDDTPPPVTGRDGLLAVNLALAAKRSLTQRRPIAVEDV